MLEELSNILERVTDGFVALDNEWRYTFVNRRAGEMFGRRPEDLVGKSIWEEFPEAVGQPFYHAYRRAVAEQVSVEIEAHYAPWERWFSSRIYPAPDGVSIFFEDITERKLTEERLAERENLLRAIIETEPECVKLVARDGTVIDMNRAGLAMVEADSPEQVLGQNLCSLITPGAHRCAFDELTERVFAGGSGAIEFEITGLKGTRRLLETRAVPFRQHGGEVTALLGITRDITERRAAEAALRESEEKFRTLAESSASAILYHRDDGAFTYVNPAAERMTGYTRDELLRLRLWDLLHPDFRAAVESRLRARLAGETINEQYEVPMVIKGGEVRWVSYTAGRAVLGGAPVIIAMATDVTDRRHAEQELHASHEQLRALAARLESVREEEGTRIAREIHDELGSTLTGLKWDLEWLERELPQTETRALGKVAGMVEIVNQTLVAVRRISAELRPGILDDLGLVAAVEWQARQFKARTGIDTRCETPGAEVELGREVSTAVFRMLQEILTNVLRHAGARSVHIRVARAEPDFVLEVSDDGRGISEAEKYNPGSLGLAGMRERAHLFGGSVEVSGVEGRGTTVTVRVPLA